MITKLRYGNTNTFLICGERKNILVDTDYAGTMQEFYKEIKSKNISVNDIDYVIATHYHPDHIGLVSELMKQGVRLILVESQTAFVHYSDSIFSRDVRLDYRPIDDESAVLVSSDKSRKFLKEMGIDGEIILTPSHSDDSITIVLDDGVCIVGDLEPIDYLEAYDNNEALKADWDKVMSYNPKIVYYAHANEKYFS